MKEQNPLTTKKPVHISITIADDVLIRKENKKHLKRDYTTDVLSFELTETLEDGSLYLGDVLVNKEQAKKQAKDYKNTWEEEIAELVAHGVLHLLGVHHKDDDKESVHGVKSKA